MTREPIGTKSAASDFGRGVEKSWKPLFTRTLSQNRKVFKQADVRPEAAFYSTQPGEFLLMYDDVRKAKSPSGS